jgi:hypothetical protein
MMQLSANEVRPSRAMISGEFSWAFVALVYAWAGAGAWPFEPGVFYHALQATDHPTVWPIVIAPPALALMIVSGNEWLSHLGTYRRMGRGWTLAELDQSVKFRGWCCLLLIMAWLYMLYVLLPAFGPQVEGAKTLIALAIGGIVFTGWFYIENRRVRREIRNHISLVTLQS